MKKLALLFLMASLLLCVPAGKALAATYTVTNCATSGDGSMKQAILDANSNSGTDLIAFNIPTSEATWEAGNPSLKWWKIRVPGDYAWPNISEAVIIDGTTQPTTDAYNNPYGPEIEIDGYQSPANQSGLKIYTSECVVKGLVINRFTSDNSAGIYISGSNNRIYGCYIGTDVSGEADRGNYSGITMWSPASVQFNIIGSTESSNRNIISGNDAGIYIGGSTDVSSNEVIGNYIGTDRTGTSPLGNSLVGVVVTDEAQYNKIGDGTAAGRNVISGNGGYGIVIGQSNTKYNQVLGNYIGTASDGATALPNTNDGVYISDGAQENSIGLVAAAIPNVISGNGRAGVEITGSGTNNNVVDANYIGTDNTGNAALPNQYNGVIITGEAQSNRIRKGNVISGNSGDGVLIMGTNTNSNEVLENYIGTKANGTDPLGNTNAGVYIIDAAQYNKIGDGTTGGRNIISGNNNYGVEIDGTSTNSNEVLGNYIGTDVNGTTALANKNGVYVRAGAKYNKVGGNSAGEGNLISGNTFFGVRMSIASDRNEVLGNKIGIKANGTEKLPNQDGVLLDFAAKYNRIGDGTSGGRNIISGNDRHGVSIYGTNTNSNEVLGNYIGTTSNGASSSGNTWHGVHIFDAAQYNRIGGSAPGEGNVISGNSGDGVNIKDTDTNSNEVLGNYIGTNYDGTAPLANNQGLRIAQGAYNKVGGSAAGERNVISGNTYNGIEIYGTGTNSNEVIGNLIGVKPNGTDALGNTNNGVLITSEARYNKIGGSAAGEGNVISGNVISGVHIGGTGTTSNEILGNYIGLAEDGDTDLGNTDYGVHISDGAQYNEIGSSEGEKNIISGNDNQGVFISGANTDNNKVLGNYIGLAADGETDRGNHYYGVYIVNQAQYNEIGGNATGEGNVISGNGWGGVGITDQADDNRVLGNIIGLKANGAEKQENSTHGVFINDSSSDNWIGDGTPGGRNIISGNGMAGVEIEDNTCFSNKILGNYIGTDVTGEVDLGNSENGVQLYDGPSNTQIGSTEGERNVISGNDHSGIIIRGASDNQVLGNYIGTDWTGTQPLGNSHGGVAIWGDLGTAADNTIGDGTSGGRNIISGNLSYGGITIVSTEAYDNEIFGNFIGTDATGAATIENRGSGVNISGGAHHNLIGDSWPAGRGNVISGYPGGAIVINAADYNDVLGNLIGTTSDETAPLGNGFTAVSIGGGAQYNRIGDGSTGGRNVISAAEDSGIVIGDTDTNFNEVLGNYIGGSTLEGFGNAKGGVSIGWGASYNKIGGRGSGERNIICGNGWSQSPGWSGVAIDGENTGSNEVIGNYIGVDEDGTTPLGNAESGIRIWKSSYNIIGSREGVTQVISANGKKGIDIGGEDPFFCDYNQILGNYIGVDENGTTPLGNGRNGIRIGNSRYTRIGDGTNDGRNVICANADKGIGMEYCTTIEVLGNNIGAVPNGDVTYEDNPFANSGGGISLSDSSYNVIGGINSDEEKNLIAGNLGSGIAVESNSEYNQILGNSIYGNREFGVAISGDSQYNQIGPENMIVFSGYGGLFILDNSGNNLIGPENVIAGNGTGEAADWFFEHIYGLIGVTLESPGILVIGETNIPELNKTKGVTITRNSIYNNRGLGIYLYNWGNDGIAAPSIESIAFDGSSATVSGNAIAGSTVEVFDVTGQDPWGHMVYPDPGGSGEGFSYLGSDIADGGGSWSVLIPSLTPYTTLSATATDTNGSTSMFSVNKIAIFDVDGPVIKITSPSRDGGEIWSGGTSQTIVWEVYDESEIAAFDIYYSTTEGTDDYPYSITTEASLAGVDTGRPHTKEYSYPWSVPYINAVGKIKITARDLGGNYGTAESEWFRFSTVVPVISITRPALNDRVGGVTYGVTYEVMVEVEPALLDIWHSTDGGANWTVDETDISVSNGTNSYIWDVPQVNSTNCYISMEVEDDVGRTDQAISERFTIDRVAPQVLTISPTNGATGVAVGSPIEVVFSKAMDTPSVEDAVSITPTVSGNFSWSIDSETLTFTPSHGLLWNTAYTITIEVSAKDTAGNALSSAATSSFTTAVPHDTTTPEVVVKIRGVTIKSGDPIPPQPTIEAIITDDIQIGVSGVKMYLDGSEVDYTVLSSSINRIEIEYRVITNLVPGKNHSIIVEATDAVGNTATKEITGLVVAPEKGRPRLTNLVQDRVVFSPTNGEKVTIAFMLDRDADLIIYVYSSDGTVVWTRAIAGYAGYNTFQFDGLSDIIGGAVLGNGTYLIQITSGGRELGRVRVIIQD